ncbi:MAG: hypothetical protein ACI9FN_000414 [Saprospiraceae bacterium]|jgi:hypothetical protein
MNSEIIKRSCGLIVCLIVSGMMMGQISFGVKGGINFPNLSDDSDNIYSSDFTSITTASFGILMDFPVSSTFSIQPELMMAGRGGKRNGLQPLPPGNIPSQLSALLPAGVVPYAEFDNRSTLDYIEIPVLMKLSFGSKFKISPYAGPYLGILVNAKQKTSGTSPLYLDPNKSIQVTNPLSGQPLTIDLTADIDTKNEINSSNFGVHGGVMFTKMTSDIDGFFLDARVTYGFSSLQRNAQLGETKIGSISISFGYMQSI